MDLEKDDLQRELAEIRQPGGAHHERWLKRDPDVLKMEQGLYQKLWPEPLPEPDKPQAEIPEQEAVDKKPAEENSAAKFDVEAERQAGEQELKQQWGDEYQTKMAIVYEVRDTLFSPADKTDQEILGHFNGHFGNDPRFIALLPEVKDRIADLPKQRADITGMAEKEKDAIGAQFITGLLRDLRTPLAQEIYQSIPPHLLPKVRDWAAERGARLYRWEKRKGR